MVKSRSTADDINKLLRIAVDFHGHLGPFLALGVRTSLAGLRELKTSPGDRKLRVRLMLKYAVPFSCMIDGVQTVTKCTVGNKRLSWKESEEMSALFSILNGEQIEAIVNPALMQELGRKFAEKPSEEKIRQLALDIATRPETSLVSLKRR